HTATPHPPTRTTIAHAANAHHYTPHTIPSPPWRELLQALRRYTTRSRPEQPQRRPPPLNRRSSAPAANGVHSTPQSQPFAPGAGAPTGPTQHHARHTPVEAAQPPATSEPQEQRPRPDRGAHHPPAPTLRTRGGSPPRPNAAPPPAPPRRPRDAPH